MVKRENREKVEFIDKKVIDLAYVILATFNSLAYHLYDIEYKNQIYDSQIDIEDDNIWVTKRNVTTTNLNSIKIKGNKIIILQQIIKEVTSMIIENIISILTIDFKKADFI